jgi:D-alanyl-D-alanine carboxypeptidase
MRVDKLVTKDNITCVLEQYVGSKVPGLQCVVADAGRTLFEYAGGWADIQNQRAMTPDTTLMAYSITKTFTAIATLQLVEQGKLGLDDPIDSYIPETPYRGRRIAIRQLLDHTAGLPNPIPLRWVHLADEAANFNEDAALAQVLRQNPQLKFEPGRKFSYSNIGYWLLGKIVERASERSYSDYVTANILMRLDPSGSELDFVIRDPTRHAKGYLARYSLMNLLKGFLTDRKFWGAYEGDWLLLKSHYLDGPAFGGLVGSARGFGRFLQDQLQDRSALFGAETKRLLEMQQTDRAGRPIPMTLGWHVGKANSAAYFFKEGGGGGFHSEMRIYPAKTIASVVMANGTEFNSRQFLNRLDGTFLEP